MTRDASLLLMVNLKDWWTKADADKFKLKADEVVAQYNAFTLLDSLHVNGRLTLGENLADLGGLKLLMMHSPEQNSLRTIKRLMVYANTKILP
jgi:predicted metalloendopeptidase